ncbi:RNA-directed DNA polymerase [Nitrosomonas sp.]|uniref:RNA-directed DNA polymerase n=1 Tax=Nitrosomonas sp. TaxID=42353 RepID=UPI0025D0AC30|nr:RNA-directed DNA polymerase [Nitrosomonas sp.]MCC6916400.1 RNA-directed DNA polymerase [Nitrosomonas sp.]
MNATTSASSKKSILELPYDEARKFFLKPTSYCSLDLPPYIGFGGLLDDVSSALTGKQLSGLSSGVRDHHDVNYTIFHNKDGRYAWRPFQLIHPAIYVSLVQAMTDEAQWNSICARFQEFSNNKKIRCLSLPVVSTSKEKDRAEQVSQWWQEVEQRSIQLSLEYDYVLETDVTDCYGAIYTHSIAWALHTKEEAKKKRRDNGLVGNVIDNHIQDMRHGQTNGIPQGSALMNFIAETVLGLADLELSQRIEELGLSDYQVLRYRDDYRVFINNPQDGDAIAKAITEITTGLGLKLNPSKTRASSDVVRASIRGDKLAWMGRKQREKDLQKHLLIVHDHATNHPNSGSLVRALSDYHKRLLKSKPRRDGVMPLIAIVVDIAYRNPRTYPITAAILSILLEFLEDDEVKKSTVKRIQQKFGKLPNTGHMQIWLQRATLPIDKDIAYQEAICKLVTDEKVSLWNSDWISSNGLKAAVDAIKIVDTTIRDQLAPVIQSEEVELFLSNVEGYYG